MQDLNYFLKDRQIKVTPQRLSVFSALAASNSHLSAEELHNRVRENLPAVSLGTVYAILEHFKNKGLVREIKITSNKTFFEARNDPHHHFLCRVCGCVFDIDIPLCETLKQKEVEGNVIDDFQGYFYGICEGCKNGKTRGAKQ